MLKLALPLIALAQLSLGGLSALAQQAERSMDELEQDCMEGDAEACGFVGYYYAREVTPSTDETDELSTAYYFAGCTTGDFYSCAGLGEAYLEGRGIDQDRIQALDLLDVACDEGILGACEISGYEYANGDPDNPDFRLAYERMSMACSDTRPRACGELGRFMFNGQGTSRDLEGGMDLLEQACDGGYGESCKNLSLIYGGDYNKPEDMRTAFTYAQMGCEVGHADSCERAGDIARHGNLILDENSTAVMARYYDMACEGGLWTACAKLESE